MAYRHVPGAGATHSSEPGSLLSWSSRAGKQFVWILTSLGLAGTILYLIPPRMWESGCIPFYVAVLGLLVLVIFVSSDVKGSHSWFNLGPIRFQPAEISKISTSLLLAYVMSQQNFRITRWKDFWTVVLIIGVPMLVIIGESETGSALVYAGFIFVLYREGLSGWWLGAIGLVIILFVGTLRWSAYWSVMLMTAMLLLCNAAEGPAHLRKGRLLYGGIFVLVMGAFPFVLRHVCDKVQAHMDFLSSRVWVLLFRAWSQKDRFLAISLGVWLAGVALVFSTDYLFQNVLQPHQRSRIEVLLGLKEDPSGVGYNVLQSKIAIGSGGLFGKGFLQGTQTTFGFVPEQATDFIFCTVGEEWGFLGCLLVIGLYTFLITRLVLDAESCRGKFTRIYGYCVASCVFMHLFINVGMTIGLMPVIGIPLPLLSYGGSSLWAFTILIFIFLSLYRNEKKYF